MNSWRIGAVSYLNTKPLVHRLDDASSAESVQFDLPSRLAEKLAARELDVALIPSIDAFQSPNYTVVSDACIACRGPVWSVKLLSRVPADSIRTLSLDEGSRTSVALVRILLKEHYQLEPALQPLAIDADWRSVESDAVLIIGDRAMSPKGGHHFAHQIDLGAWWYEWTGLPFVFAMWTANLDDRQKSGLNELDLLFSSARDRGLAELEFIAESNAERYGLSKNLCLDYFRDFLHYQMGAQEKKGLAMFRTMAAQMDLAPKTLELQFHDC